MTLAISRHPSARGLPRIVPQASIGLRKVHQKPLY